MPKLDRIDLREIGTNLLLVFLSLSLFLAGLEGALRVGLVPSGTYYDRGDYPKTAFCSGEEVYEFHPRYGWKPTDGTKYVKQRNPADAPNRYTHNARGWRDTFDSGNETVLVFGDSFTYGALVNDSWTYPHLLDTWTPSTRFENYGVGGFSTAQELLLYQGISNDTEHDVVVVGYYLGNDATENLDSQPERPRFRIRDGALVQIHEPERGGSVPGTEQPPTILQRVRNFVADNVETYGFLAPRVRGVLIQSGVIEPPTPPGGDAREREMQVAKALLTEWSREAAANDASVVVVVIPERGDVVAARPHRYRPSEGEPYWNRQREMLHQVETERSNVAVVDLESRLAAAVDNGSRVYGKLDGHLDDYGHWIAAQALYEYLRDAGDVSERGMVGQPDTESDVASCGQLQ